MVADKNRPSLEDGVTRTSGTPPSPFGAVRLGSGYLDGLKRA